MTHDEIVGYDVAKLAKDKGFDVPTFGYYRIDTKDWYRTDVYDDWNDSTIRYSAPTQSLLQRWLREEKGVTICVDIFDDGWFFDISTFYKQDTGIYEVDIPYKSSNVSPVYDTYELALEDALEYALENLI